MTASEDEVEDAEKAVIAMDMEGYGRRLEAGDNLGIDLVVEKEEGGECGEVGN